jgi:hypothetical protein
MTLDELKFKDLVDSMSSMIKKKMEIKELCEKA